MKGFFMKFFVKGIMVILVVIIIWIIYFILNFLDPTLFNFLRTNNIDTSATSTVQANKSIGYKIYDMFFKSNSTAPTEISTSTIPKRNLWNSSSTVVWGGDTANIWGSAQSISQNALEGQTFVYPNTSTSPIRGMKINTLLVNDNNFNYLPNGGIISGSIYTGFLSSYYFNVDIYDINGTFLFSIPITSTISTINTDTFSNFYGQYNKNLNYSNYQGKGYMVIKSDNQNVSGSVLVKIELK